MFHSVKKQLELQFENLTKSANVLFLVNVDRDKIWEIYLNSFEDPIIRQEHNCNFCKSFMRQYSGLFVIDAQYVRHSMWDFDLTNVDLKYHAAVKAIKAYVHSLPISNVFYNSFVKLGTSENIDLVKNVRWEHFSLICPNFSKVRREDEIPTKQAEKRNNKEMLERSLDKISESAIDVVLDLIAQNSIYRGQEFKSLIIEFQKIQKEAEKIPAVLKQNYYWLKSQTLSPAISSIKNSAIGTLLVDVSEGMELDAAVRSFESKVAPMNYKRPTAVVSTKMIEEARKTLEELGALNSLNRRYAKMSDIDINNLIFVDRSQSTDDFFDVLKKDVNASIDPKTFSKVEVMSMEDFIVKVIPTSKSVKLLLQNTHLPNFFSLITANDPNSKQLFKWDNHFSWAYTGGITDSIKERVKSAGGSVEGDLRISLAWNNHDDLDIHFKGNGSNQHLYFGNRSILGGQLDVDANRSSGDLTKTPVENIIFKHRTNLPNGKYEIYINNYNRRSNSDTNYVLQIAFDDQLFEFSGVNPKENASTKPIILTVKDGQFSLSEGTGKVNIIDKEKWNLKTNSFVLVKAICLSPNYWNTQVGNKHYLFILEGCESDETTRPIFNEFLHSDFHKHRKAFELIGSKLTLSSSVEQVSGVGFSDTRNAEMYFSVKGSFERIIKVII